MYYPHYPRILEGLKLYEMYNCVHLGTGHLNTWPGAAVLSSVMTQIILRQQHCTGELQGDTEI